MNDDIKILRESTQEVESKLDEYFRTREVIKNQIDETKGKLQASKEEENNLIGERERLQIAYQEAILPLEFNLQGKQ